MCFTENPMRRTERKSVRQKRGMSEWKREKKRDIEEQIVCVCVCLCKVCEQLCVSVQLQHLVFHPVTPPPVLMSTFSLLGSFTGVCKKQKQILRKDFELRLRLKFVLITSVSFGWFPAPNSQHWLSHCCCPADQDVQTSRAMFWWRHRVYTFHWNQPSNGLLLVVSTH